MIWIVFLAAILSTDRDLPRITPEERGKFYFMLHQVSDLLQNHKIPFWGISGTLLGAIRHRGMIPWDDDIDLIIHIHDKEELDHLKDELQQLGLTLYSNKYFYKIFPTDGYPIAGMKWKYPFIDIFTVNQLKKQVCIVSPTDSNFNLFPGWFLRPEEIALPQVYVPFGPLQLPIPHDAETILTREYGADWHEIAYLTYDHRHEKPLEQTRVPLTDYSPAPYILPKDIHDTHNAQKR